MIGIFRARRDPVVIGKAADAEVRAARRFIESLAATMVERGALDMAPSRAASTANLSLAMKFPREEDQRRVAGIAVLMLAERIAGEIAATERAAGGRS